MQLAIALGAGSLLFILYVWPALSKNQRSRQEDILNTAYLQFHKHQCYLVSAIEIAAIMRLKLGAGGEAEQRISSYLIDVPLALSGSLPVTFGLIVLSRYNRLTWYLILLTILPICLSSSSLYTTSEMWKGFYGEMLDGVDQPYRNADQLKNMVCGSRAGELNPLYPAYFNSGIVWTIQAICAAFYALYIFWRLPKSPFGQRSIKYYNYKRFINILRKMSLLTRMGE